MIDTASNYRGGRGEKAIGYALTALHEQLGFTREMLFISTKAGFLEEDLKEKVRQHLEGQAKLSHIMLCKLIDHCSQLVYKL